MTILAARKSAVVPALLMAATHVLAWMASFWLLLTIPPRYEKLFSGYRMRLPAATEAVFASAHHVTSRPDLLPFPLLFLLGLDVAALLVLRWYGEKGWSWVWFLVILALLLLPLTLLGAGVWLAEQKMRETLLPRPVV